MQLLAMELLLLGVSASGVLAGVAGERPPPAERLRASGSNVHPATVSAATRFALDPSAACSFTWAHPPNVARGAVQAAFQLTVRDAATGGVAYDFQG